MTRKAFNKIAEGLKEARSVARGEAKPFKLHAPLRKNTPATSKAKSVTKLTQQRSG